MAEIFLSEKEKSELKSGVDLKNLSLSDIQFIYDLYITKYPAYQKFPSKLVAEVISTDLGINITERNIDVIRDSNLQEEVLDKKLLMQDLGYYYNEEDYENQ